MPKDVLSAFPRDSFLGVEGQNREDSGPLCWMPSSGARVPLSVYGCPHRLAAGSVDSPIGKLRAILKASEILLLLCECGNTLSA